MTPKGLSREDVWCWCLSCLGDPAPHSPLLLGMPSMRPDCEEALGAGCKCGGRAKRCPRGSHLPCGSGSCKGTNQISAIPLLFLSEKDVFWVPAQLVTKENHAMRGRRPAGTLTGLGAQESPLQGCSTSGGSGDLHPACLPRSPSGSCSYSHWPHQLQTILASPLVLEPLVWLPM